MGEIDKINSHYTNLDVIKLVPCNCENCKISNNPHFFKESELIERKIFGRYKIECGRIPFKEADVLEMLLGIGISKNFEFDEHHKLSKSLKKYKSLKKGAKVKNKNKKISQKNAGNIFNSNGKKFYQKWWFDRIILSFIISLISAGSIVWISHNWFDFNLHFLDGFVLSFPLLTAFLFSLGNPDRRFFRAGIICLTTTCSIGLLNWEGTLSYNSRNLPISFEGVIQFLSEWDWLLMVILGGLSFFLFWLDYKKDE